MAAVQPEPWLLALITTNHHSSVKRVICPFYISDCVFNIYLLMADLDSRNLSQCIMKDYCTKFVCYVWSDN
jgi:hypothetical protein